MVMIVVLDSKDVIYIGTGSNASIVRDWKELTEQLQIRFVGGVEEAAMSNYFGISVIVCHLCSFGSIVSMRSAGPLFQELSYQKIVRGREAASRAATIQ